MSRWACWLCGSPCATNAARDGGHLALVHAMVFHSGRLGWHSPHWYTWADSYMPWVGSAPPCGDQVPTWGQGPCTITWWREVTLMASLGAGVALVSPVGDWHASLARGDAPSCCSPPILC